MADYTSATVITGVSGNVAPTTVSNIAELSDGSLVYIAIYTDTNTAKQYMNVYRSTDKGQNFSLHSRMRATNSNAYSYIQISPRGMQIAGSAIMQFGAYYAVLFGMDFSVVQQGTVKEDLQNGGAGYWALRTLPNENGSSATSAGIYGVLYASDGNVYVSWYQFVNYSSQDDEYLSYYEVHPYGSAVGTYTRKRTNPDVGLYTGQVTAYTIMEYGGKVLFFTYGGGSCTTYPLGAGTGGTFINMFSNLGTSNGGGTTNTAMSAMISPDGYMYMVARGANMQYQIWRTNNFTSNTVVWTQVTGVNQIPVVGGVSNNILGAQMGGDGLIYIFSTVDYNGASCGVYVTIVHPNGTVINNNVRIIGSSAGLYANAVQMCLFGGYTSITPKTLGVRVVFFGTPTVYTWSRSFNSPPNPPVNLLVDGKPITGAYTNNKRPVFNWTFNDPNAGDYQTAFEVAVSRDGFATWYTGSGVTTSGNQYWQCGVDLPDGNVWQIAVRTADSSGVFSDWAGFVNFTIDTTPPVIGGITPPVSTRNATQRIAIFNVSDNLSGIRNVDVYILNKAENAWQGPFAAINAGGGTWYYDFNVAWEGEGGRHVVDIWVYNNAGSGALAETIVIYDITPHAAPTQTNGILYATSNSVSWSAYYDYGSLAGLLLTTLYLEKWNGSTYVTESGYPKSVAGLSNAITGLTPATQYRWGVTYTDNAGNVSPLNYTNFTTNSYAVSTINNLVSGGVVYKPRPRIKFTVTDANDATLTDFEVQFATDAAFTQNVGGGRASQVPAQFSATSAASGSTIFFTPVGDRSAGSWYVRVMGYDGKDWGLWSAAVQFTIAAATFPTTIAANDTTISKRTIDDIRSKVNAVRQGRGMAVIVWTDSAVKDWTNGASSTDIRTIHLIELRQAINDIYVALNVTVPTWNVDPIIDTTVDRKGQHWIDLRNNLVLV